MYTRQITRCIEDRIECQNTAFSKTQLLKIEEEIWLAAFGALKKITVLLI